MRDSDLKFTEKGDLIMYMAEFIILIIMIWLVCSDFGNALLGITIEKITDKSKYLFARKEKRAKMDEEREKARKREEERKEIDRRNKNPNNWLSHRMRSAGLESQEYKIAFRKSFRHWEEITSEIAPELLDFITVARAYDTESWGMWVQHMAAVKLLEEGYYLYCLVGSLFMNVDGSFYTKEWIISHYKGQYRKVIEEFNKSGEIYL